jgi:hypothetical protein
MKSKNAKIASPDLFAGYLRLKIAMGGNLALPGAFVG